MRTVQSTSTRTLKTGEFLDNSSLESQYQAKLQSIAEVLRAIDHRHAIKVRNSIYFQTLDGDAEPISLLV